MARKGHSEEEILRVLREAESGETVVEVCRKHGISQQSFYLWKKKYAGLGLSELRELRQLREENGKLKRLVADLKGKLHSWDVVNEAVNPPDRRPDGLRNGPWLKLLGPEFIPLAFRTARAADPDVLLTYNDYGVETDSDGDVKKRAAILELVRGMKEDKVPIDAVGIQSHIHVGWSTADSKGLREWMRTLRGLGQDFCNGDGHQ